MAYVLSKCLDNDMCDEINKLVVNDKINQLEDDNIKLEIDIDDLQDEINDYDTFVSELQQEIYDLRDLQEVSITDIIASMNSDNSSHPNRFEIYAEEYFDCITMTRIAENFDNFEDWYSTALVNYITDIVWNKTYKITLSQIFQVIKYFKENDDDSFNLDFDYHSEKRIAQKVVSKLIQMRINEQVSNNAIQIKVTMEDWYNEKVKWEAKEEAEKKRNFENRMEELD